MQATSLSQTTNLLASTAETTIVSADANARNHLTGLIITSTDTAASVITIRDSTGGTTRLQIDFPSGTSALTPFVVMFDPPLQQLTAANNNWTAQASVNAGSIKINALFVKEF